MAELGVRLLGPSGVQPVVQHTLNRYRGAYSEIDPDSPLIYFYDGLQRRGSVLTIAYAYPAGSAVSW
jgi:hypothetical protein